LVVDVDFVVFEPLLSTTERRESELFVAGGGEHVEGGVPALAVVERLDVLEHGRLQLEPVRPGAAVDELLLEGREEGLGDGVDAPMVVK
jgi:hypothetical protein